MGLRRIELILDDEDFDAIQAGPTILPDGESNLAGAILAEVCRDLNDCRDMIWKTNGPA